MADFEQQEIPFKERRLRSTKLRRGIFILPSMFTVANLLCGYYAIVASLIGGLEQFDHAAKAIGFAILFDSLDGRVARMTGSPSSAARSRACARCCGGPHDPNHASFDGLKMNSGRCFSSTTWPEKIIS